MEIHPYPKLSIVTNAASTLEARTDQNHRATLCMRCVSVFIVFIIRGMYGGFCTLVIFIFMIPNNRLQDAPIISFKEQSLLL